MNTTAPIATAQSTAPDARLAVQEFHEQLGAVEAALVLFFCSSDYDLEALADEMNRRFPGVSVVGCTTAGEIGPAGYLEKSLSGVALPSGGFTAVAGCLESLQGFDPAAARTFGRDLLHRLEAVAPPLCGRNAFGLLLVDGLSVREEVVAHAFQSVLGPISLVGGSAADGVAFSRTRVFHDGGFHDDSAVLVLAHTELPFRPFKTQHFLLRDERLVVTEADAPNRVVREINGLPAAEEYARLIGVAVSELDPMHFAGAPVVVVLDGTDYVRSIQKANPDGSLTFYCAIDEGLVLRVAAGEDLLADLRRTFTRLREQLGPPRLVLAFDCILRRLEVAHKGQVNEVGKVFRDNAAVGFSTYGEQYGGVHVNQTLTGIAFGGGI